MSLIILILAAICTAISQLSNQNKLYHFNRKWWDGYHTNAKNYPLWQQSGPGVVFRDAFHCFFAASVCCWIGLVILPLRLPMWLHFFQIKSQFYLFVYYFSLLGLIFGCTFELTRFVFPLLKIMVKK